MGTHGAVHRIEEETVQGLLERAMSLIAVRQVRNSFLVLMNEIELHATPQLERELK
jgi:hypothetical protein